MDYFCTWNCQSEISCCKDKNEHFQNERMISYSFTLTMFDSDGNIVLDKSFIGVKPSDYFLFAASPVMLNQIGRQMKIVIEDLTNCVDGLMKPLSLLIENDFNKEIIPVFFKCLSINTNNLNKRVEISITKYNGFKLFLNK